MDTWEDIGAAVHTMWHQDFTKPVTHLQRARPAPRVDDQCVSAASREDALTRKLQSWQSQVAIAALGAAILFSTGLKEVPLLLCSP
mmetsp:Transcript_15861/g.36279  ORF Transcript_15861/g.36279 Transcript_15861/m.36279 type:complete len:86 (+) Transcript_15861:338-595(+)